MTIDLGLVLYVENAILTAGVMLAWIHRDGHTVWQFKDSTDEAPPPFVFLALGTMFWPLAWGFAAVAFVATMIRKLGVKQSA